MVAFLNNKLISDQLPANIKPVIDKIKQNPAAIKDLFNSLLTPTANNSWLLQDALLNPENFFSILGFKNKIIVDKSPLSYLKNILENVMGISGAFKTMTKYINDFNVKEQKIAATMYQTFNNLQVTVLAQTVDNIFEYQINNRIIKIGVEIVGDKYLINEITIN